MLAAMRAQLAKVESDTIRKAIVARYPHIMEPSGPRPPRPNAYGVDTVSVSSRYKIREKEKISAGAAPVKGAPARQPEKQPAKHLESGALVVSEEVARILKRDFPGVDYAKQLERARAWCALRGQSIRNILLFLRKWFANAAKWADHVAEASKMMPCPVPAGYKPSPAAPVVKARLTADPFRTPTADELEENARRGLEMLALWKQGRGVALA